MGGHGLGEVHDISGLPAIFLSFLGYNHFGVTTFMVISGFCLAIPVARNRGVIRGGVLNFFRKRACRILPTYYFALFLSLGLIGTLIGTPDHTVWDAALPVHARTILTHLLLLHNFFNPFAINYPLWSIAVEWQIYFLFPALVYALARCGAARTLLAVFLASGVLELYLLLRTKLWGVPAHYVWLFTMGMIAAEIGFGRRLRPAWEMSFFWMSILTGGCLLVLLCYTGIFFRDDYRYVPLLDLFAGATAAGLLAGMATGRYVLLRRLLEWKPLVRIGIFSYSLYLIHAPLLEVAGVLCFVAEPVIVLAAFLFFLVCERPFMTPALRKNVARQGEQLGQHTTEK
jgi:peptidoglycan/LPS O-acetylase OafA/YrhL